MSEEDLKALTSSVARFTVPEALLTAEEVGVLCGGYSARYVMEKLSKVLGFPETVRLPLPNGKLGDPHWRCGEIREYLSTLGQKSRPGRRRNRVVSA